MMHIDFKTSLRKATADHQKADQLLASLKADVKSYLLEKFGIVLVATAIGAAAGGAVGYGVGAGMLTKTLHNTLIVLMSLVVKLNFIDNKIEV